MDQPDRLNDTLQTWQPEPSAQPGFAAQVAARVQAETAPPTRRSLWWPLAAGLAVLLGGSAGLVHARQHHQSTMADAYVRTIDPVQRVHDTDSH